MVRATALKKVVIKSEMDMEKKAGEKKIITVKETKNPWQVLIRKIKGGKSNE